MSTLQTVTMLMTVDDVRAEPSPGRQLVFTVRVTPPQQEWAVLRTWVRASLMNTCVSEGDTVQVMSALVHPAVVGGSSDAYLKVKLPLSSEALYRVEDLRLGGDLEYHLEFSLVAAPVVTLVDNEVLGQPQAVRVADRAGNYGIKGKIAQSDWLGLMRQLGWQETDIIEISLAPVARQFPEAYRRFEEARDRFRRGDWEGTLQACRLVQEAVARSVSTGEQRANPARLRELFGDGVKGDRLNDVSYALGQYLHLARHDSGVTIQRADGLYALSMTSAFLTFAGQS